MESVNSIGVNKMEVKTIEVGSDYQGDTQKALAARKENWQRKHPPVLPTDQYAQQISLNPEIQTLSGQTGIPASDLVALTEDDFWKPTDPLFVPAFKAYTAIHSGILRMNLSTLGQMGVPDNILDDLAAYRDHIKEKDSQGK